MTETNRLILLSEPPLADPLAAARRGDPQGFSSAAEPYRHELRVHCYRILGSFQEAEELVQETMLRAWKRLDTYQGRASFRAWLYKIATHACLDALDRRRARRSLPEVTQPSADPRDPIIPPAADPIWLEPYPDEWLATSVANPEARVTALESISLAFLAALQVLPPRQRAVLLLRDVLDWPAREAADLLDLTVSAVNSALHRARTTLAAHYQGSAPEELPGAQTDDRTQALLKRYMSAWETADVDALVALLKEEASFSMPPSPSWYRGRSAVGALLAATVFADGGMFPGAGKGRWRFRATRANGQPALAIYLRAGEDRYQALGLQVLTLRDGSIAAVHHFTDPSLPERFGLPGVWEAG